ncbi:AfsR/SARP family transcriptional regulator [Streptomyces sp. NPDC054796]
MRTLLALLCLNANRPVPPARIINALWSGNPPRTAATALQVYVSKLRQQISHADAGNTVITTDSSGYTLRTDSCASLDLTVFDFLTRRAQQVARAGQAREAASLLSESLRLWDGAALADVRGASTMDAYARQLEERRNAVREKRMEIELSLGRHSQLIGELYVLLEEHPMWENLYAYLMIALYRSGRVPECLAVYHALRRQLDEDLGMEPCTRLRELHRAVLAREPWLDHVDSPLSAA